MIDILIGILTITLGFLIIFYLLIFYDKKKFTYYNVQFFFAGVFLILYGVFKLFGHE